MPRSELIIVKAKITMKTAGEGGRSCGFSSGYRPNHVFDLPYDLRKLTAYVGDIQFAEEQLIEPGETRVVTVRFLNSPGLEKYISVGRIWYINEGAKTVGFGEILEI